MWSLAPLPTCEPALTVEPWTVCPQVMLPSRNPELSSRQFIVTEKSPLLVLKPSTTST